MSEEHQERIESDSLGDIAVPADAYWGAQTQRAIENFPISNRTMDRRFIGALGIVKLGAAKANDQLDTIPEQTTKAIEQASREVIDGNHDDQFPVDVFQTGSGTSTNMNANEVIANRGAEIIGEPLGSKAIHPNDHVNCGQSSNDVIPTAMHVATLQSLVHDLKPALETLRDALEAKERAFDDVVKTGRTHLQDATPVRMGQEFGGYRTQMEKGLDRIAAVEPDLEELALGGTAVGTGLNTHPDFSELAIEVIRKETGLAFREARNHFEAQASHDAMAQAHSALQTVSGSLDKIAHDLRLLVSGPRNGFGEVAQPENQPGSSIMPGKINPVIAESVQQIHAQVRGNDATVSAGAARGELELNLYKPVIVSNVLESSKLLANGAETFANRFVANLEANRNICAKQVERSLGLATALNPAIGYDAATDVAKTALTDGLSVREAAIQQGYLTETEAETVIDPIAMTEPGVQTE